MRLFLYFAVSILWTSLAIALCSGHQADSVPVDAIKAGSTPYFTTKMENLTSKLGLTQTSRPSSSPSRSKRQIC
jgi:hypothetical protein